MTKIKNATRYVSKEEALNALKIVESIVMSDMQMNEYFNSGDRDTLNNAFEAVWNKNEITPISIYDLNSETIDNYYKEHGEEIYTVFDKIVESGKQDKILHEKIINYLKSYHDCYNISPEIEHMFFGSLTVPTEFTEKIIKCTKCGKDIIVDVPIDKRFKEYYNNTCQECIDNIDLPF